MVINRPSELRCSSGLIEFVETLRRAQLLFCELAVAGKIFVGFPPQEFLATLTESSRGLLGSEDM